MKVAHCTVKATQSSPEAPEVVPGPVDVPAPAAGLALGVAGDERLRGHGLARLPLDAEAVGGHPGGREGPRGAAPTLVAHPLFGSEFEINVWWKCVGFFLLKKILCIYGQLVCSVVM